MPDYLPGVSPETRARAKKLRTGQTFPERVLWERLRAKRLAGLKFRRQFPIGPYVVDYICPAHSLVIEVDGDGHQGRADFDHERTRYLEELGLRVLRVSNDDVLNDIDAVLEAVLRACGIKVE
ncbi:MAG: DUF559 domain-containing protein [Pirellulales bacterium]